MYGTISGPGGSALSKSMKYAETWLYGSVRTQTPPTRPSVFTAYPEVSGPVLISTPQKPTPHNYAVILCSCPEYLNGTKKTSSTKVSICKKCKGSRLPLTIADSPHLLVGGTVRGHHQVSRESGLLRAGTVRVQGSKARPTILKSNEDTDPYDLMRRNRLAPPHEARIGSQFSTTRLRAKSISPCRVKTKKPTSPETLRKNRSKSVSRVNEIWVEEDANSSNDSKKSILSCDINPYDLVKSNGTSKSLVEIEFDDDFGHVFQESIKNKNLHSSSKPKSDSNVKAISGQRIRISDESKTNNIDDVYDPVDYDLKSYESKTQDLSPTLSLPNIKNENKKSATVSKSTSKKILSISTSNRAKQKSVSPKRPPRRIRNSKNDDDSESDNQRITERSSNRKLENHSRSSKLKNQNTDTIKSILKKPRNYDTVESTPKIEPTNESFDSKRVNTSLFYLPKPKDKMAINSHNMLHRKRVQFLVENEETKVIYTAEFNLEQNITKEISTEEVLTSSMETEEDVVAEGDIVSHSLDVSSEKLSELISQTVAKDEIETYELANLHINTFETVVEENAEPATEVSHQTTSVEIVNNNNKEGKA